MKIAVLFCIALTSCFAQYETGKIDMHGGGDSYKYEKKNSFRSSGMGLSTFLDTNSSKKVVKKSKEKK